MCFNLKQNFQMKKITKMRRIKNLNSNKQTVKKVDLKNSTVTKLHHS
jgi:hypothetical protein